MANHALPTTASTYANFVAELNARIDDVMKWVGSGSLTNPPTNTVSWNATNKNWEINTGTPAAPSWSQLSSSYNININGTIGATTPNTGAFTTLSTSGVASLGANSTIGGVALVSISGTQTLTNKTITAPVFDTGIIKSGASAVTITLPTIADTLLGRATTDTLTNKTLTAPRLSSGTALLDANGAVLVQFPAAVASAVNSVTINNSITGTAPSLVATGSDTNISINLVSKGTGLVTGNGVQLVDISTAQTLTNKTLTTPIFTSVSTGSGTLTLPTGTDTLVSLSGTQSLTNKTLTASAFNGTVGATTPSTGVFTSLSAASLGISGTVTATTFSGAGTGLNGTASSLNIGGNAGSSTSVYTGDDNTLASTVYLHWSSGAGNNYTPYISSSKLGFVPSTGTLIATTFSGSGTGLTGTASSLNIGGTAAVATSANNLNSANIYNVAGLNINNTTGGGYWYAVTSTSVNGYTGFKYTLNGLSKYLGVNASGSLVVVNSSGASVIYSLDDAGTINTSGNIYAGGGSGTVYGATFTGNCATANSAGYAGYVNNANAYTNGTDGWWRSVGQAGWYSATYNVGIYATQAGRVDTYNNAAFYSASNITAYSDERVKTNWRDLGNDFITNLANVKSGIYDRTDIELTQVGVSAQSLLNVMPDAVILAEDGTYSVAYGNAALSAAVELAKEVVSLREEVRQLKELIK
jgi:hypothetical protein